ncbi:MAG: UpxY family transcription antiterminator [Gelidibacter sp.]
MHYINSINTRNTMPWYVLITKPKSEKKVAEKLAQRGIEVCCPVSVEVRQWSDRKKKVEVPLLPSMVLVHLEDKERSVVFETAGAVRYLFWLGKPATVSESEIDALVAVNSSPLTLQSVEKIQPGTIIDLHGLGFHSEKGTVKYVSGNQCWVVLHSLGYVIKLQT